MKTAELFIVVVGTMISIHQFCTTFFKPNETAMNESPSFISF